VWVKTSVVIGQEQQHHHVTHLGEGKKTLGGSNYEQAIADQVLEQNGFNNNL